MIRIYAIQTVLNFFDYFQQKKIFNFLRNKIKNKAMLPLRRYVNSRNVGS